MKHMIPLLLGAVLFGSSGCTLRYVLGVQDTPVATASGQATTILQVRETTWYAVFPHIQMVYYECGKDGDVLDCVRTCNVNNEEGDRIRCRSNWF